MPAMMRVSADEEIRQRPLARSVRPTIPGMDESGLVGRREWKILPVYLQFIGIGGKAS